MATVAAPIDATSTAAWKALEAHQEKLEAEGIDLKAWFAADADRVNKLSFDAGDLHFDLSKNLVTDETVKLLCDLAREVKLEERRDAMFSGEHINTTEDRAAAVMEKGRGVYLSKCAICHGNDGMGDKVTYPPLAGSEWLKEKPDAEIVKIILQGLTGPITVNGKEWDSTMLPPGVTDSRDLANLLTFLRRQFGGVEKAAYTPEQVDAIRREL